MYASGIGWDEVELGRMVEWEWVGEMVGMAKVLVIKRKEIEGETFRCR